ncbi:hypothetical protein EDB81DRAFT_925345 [Dactylonectria macrodidyma]|uniref:Cell wall mannoprotein PIR1-like C-terminal domain-containing protein n=1 Tax=Dactylonectria macrodidyma TaxID=307937 RepID=A0A9P9FHR8_9HYPO|nr:hypothetical protein EDB81DRAFT_925345 [Dactylonectria macrodidyma]
MRTSLCLLALAASVLATPQAVTEDISPKGSAPEGCTAAYSGTFEVTVIKTSEAKRDLEKRSCNGEGVLVMALENGILKDAKDRTGYIASNYQFQFDSPPQAGAIYTSGFSACTNQSLALGSSTVFYQCRSGDFYNLYDRHWAEQCDPVQIIMMPCGGQGGGGSAAKKKVVGSILAPTVVTVVSDGTTKEVATTIVVPMCQIGDGQVQVRTTPCDDMELPVITAPPVSQIDDGQIQVPTAPAVTIEVPKKVADPGKSVTEKKTNTEVLSLDTSVLKATASLKYFTSETASETTTSNKVGSATTERVSENTQGTQTTSQPPDSTAATSSGMSIDPRVAVAAFVGCLGVLSILH